MIATRSLDDFTAALLASFPTGRAWPRDPGAVFPQVVAIMAPTFWRLDARAAGVLPDSFPATTEGSLPEWEAALGLPDPCAGPEPTVALRRQQVVARLIATGGQSIPYFIGVAAALGFTITVTEFAPARADTSGADDECYEPEWAYAWEVNVAGITEVFAEADSAVADDPVSTIGNAVLECELRRIAPAHTILRFNYFGDRMPMAWNTAGAGWG